MALPSILAEILDTKAVEISAGKQWVSHEELIARAGDLPPGRGFIKTLTGAAEKGPAVIAEIKKASPSAGTIRQNFVPSEIAISYEQGGACCLSVLTDEQYFGGHRDFLAQARDACTLPVLRKDFIVDPWQIHESRCLGADCILLIVAALGDGQLQDLNGMALEAGLDVLVEVHDEEEMNRARLLPQVLLGVNNRNLHRFETRLDTTLELNHLVPDDRLLVTESGISTRDDVALLSDAGIRVFLVGEAFMRGEDPGMALRNLFFPTSDNR